MSKEAVPALYLNLAGEMLYVLDQRLRSQNITKDKGSRVMCDLITNIFEPSLIDEMFKPQSLHGKKYLATIYQKLVNSSIMKVDPASMEKLYDLMLMAFKYQVVKSTNLHDILHITLNHLDSCLKFVNSKPNAQKLAENVFHRVVDLYGKMAPGDLILVKQTLLSFFHDFKSKVSVLMSLEDQNSDGSFVIRKDREIPVGFDIPGTITYCDDGRIEKFQTGAKFLPNMRHDSSINLNGKRLTDLGLNLYGKDKKAYSAMKGPAGGHSTGLAETESKLLGHLIGNTQQSKAKPGTFVLNLFGPDGSDVSVGDVPSSVVASASSAPENKISIKAEAVISKELSEIKKDFSEIGQDSGQADDLLAMMDNA